MVVEDEMLLALDLEELLEEWGAEVVGPVPDVPRALALLAGQAPDAVTLDMNLSGSSSLEIVAELVERAIPFILISGYSDTYASEPALRDAPFVKKPYDVRQIIDALEVILKPK